MGFKKIFVVLIAGWVAAGCAGADHALPEVSEEEHGQATQKILTAPNLSPTTRTTQENEQIARRVTQRLQAVAMPICRSTERGRCWYTLQFKPDGELNAYVFKNQIVLYDGLAQYLDTEDEFAAVLAHEMGHDIAGHYEKALLNQKIGAIVAGAVFAGAATAAGYDSYQAQYDMQTAMQIGAVIGSISFSKEHEREADYIAGYLMTRAGYDPDAAGTIWIKLTKANGDMNTGMFDTHPSGPDRLAAWEETVDEVRFSTDLIPNLAGAEEERRLQVARVFDGSSANSLPENSAFALAMKSYKPEPGTSVEYGAMLGGGAQALVGQGSKASSNSNWVAQGSYDSCGAEWVLKVERKGSVLRGNMWWKDAKYDVYGNIDHKGRTKDARAGKTKASQTIPAPRFFRIEIAFEPNVARGSFAIDSTSASCWADFTLARESS